LVLILNIGKAKTPFEAGNLNGSGAIWQSRDKNVKKDPLDSSPKCNFMKSRPQIPLIETERLILRAHRPDDFPACAKMWADPKVVRYIGGAPFTAEATWSRMLRYAGLWAWLGFGYWAVEEKASGEFAGELGFADFRRETVPPVEGAPEIGWAFASAFHGKGYATEAITAALAWGDRHLESPQTFCLIHPDNAASVHVAQKCGYRRTALASYRGEHCAVFRRG
jgi:RimJ/RimL family protein N-acetyltransferase